MRVEKQPSSWRSPATWPTRGGVRPIEPQQRVAPSEPNSRGDGAKTRDGDTHVLQSMLLMLLADGAGWPRVASPGSTLRGKSSHLRQEGREHTSEPRSDARAADRARRRGRIIEHFSAHLSIYK